MKFKFFAALAALFLGSAGSVKAELSYGLPSEIKDGNILHCFDWKINDIKKALPDIAEAGFVAVQLSPLQRNSANGVLWSDVYRPLDFDLYTSGLGSEAQLKSLCSEAESYGIKVIVDVVFNHVDKAATGWWKQNDHLRSTTANVNYGNRHSITHDNMDGQNGSQYPEVNSENPEVIARAKAYIQRLHDCGVRGIRFDAAKHIALPSEGCDFWKEVTSVPDMFYYGEILDSPGGANAAALMKEYTDYMSVTDDAYGRTARGSAGTPSSNGNWVNRGIDGSKIVYWGESHDTFANDVNYGGETKNVSQAAIDRAYANVASRSAGVALYFSRPPYKAYGDIKVGQKGDDNYQSAHVAEVNKFKNAMVGRAESYSQKSGVVSITRQGGGAVIIKQTGAGNVSIANGGGFCPEGTYIDKVSGNTFTVTSETITGTTGSSGIAVIYDEDALGAGIGDVFEEDFDLETASWYTLQGIKISRPSDKGIYIVSSPSGKTKKIIL